MKLFIFILSLISTAIYSQTNFQIIENNTVWQKVYEDSINIESYLKHLKLTGKFQSIDIINEKTINFTLKYNSEDLKPFGYRFMNDAIFLQHPASASGTIELKENRYRINIFSIELTDPSTKDTLSINEYFLRKGKFREMKTVVRAIEYYDKLFLSIFAKKDISDQW